MSPPPRHTATWEKEGTPASGKWKISRKFSRNFTRLSPLSFTQQHTLATFFTSQSPFFPPFPLPPPSSSLLTTHDSWMGERKKKILLSPSPFWQSVFCEREKKENSFEGASPHSDRQMRTETESLRGAPSFAAGGVMLLTHI